MHVRKKESLGKALSRMAMQEAALSDKTNLEVSGRLFLQPKRVSPSMVKNIPLRSSSGNGSACSNSYTGNMKRKAHLLQMYSSHQHLQPSVSTDSLSQGRYSRYYSTEYYQNLASVPPVKYNTSVIGPFVGNHKTDVHLPYLQPHRRWQDNQGNAWRSTLRTLRPTLDSVLDSRQMTLARTENKKSRLC